MANVFLYRNTPLFTGISVVSFMNLAQAIQTLVPKCKLKIIDSSHVKPEKWTRDQVVIFPGGWCSEWDSGIDEVKQSALHHFIKSGGRYFGTCAGGYYAAKHVRYKLNESDLLLKERKISLFSGVCEGPTLTDNQPCPFDSRIKVAKIIWEEDQTTGFVLMSGGGSFIPHEKAKNYKVLARYADVPKESSIAIVESAVGKGKAILSGPHLEYHAHNVPLHLLKKWFPDIPKEKWETIKDALDQSYNFRMKCLEKIFHTLIT